VVFCEIVKISRLGSSFGHEDNCIAWACLEN
jgi:hypothetical protein